MTRRQNSCKKGYVLMFLLGFFIIIGAWNASAAWYSDAYPIRYALVTDNTANDLSKSDEVLKLNRTEFDKTWCANTSINSTVIVRASDNATMNYYFYNASQDELWVVLSGATVDASTSTTGRYYMYCKNTTEAWPISTSQKVMASNDFEDLTAGVNISDINKTDTRGYGEKAWSAYQWGGTAGLDAIQEKATNASCNLKGNMGLGLKFNASNRNSLVWRNFSIYGGNISVSFLIRDRTTVGAVQLFTDDTSPGDPSLLSMSMLTASSLGGLFKDSESATIASGANNSYIFNVIMRMLFNGSMGQYSTVEIELYNGTDNFMNYTKSFAGGTSGITDTMTRTNFGDTSNGYTSDLCIDELFISNFTSRKYANSSILKIGSQQYNTSTMTAPTDIDGTDPPIRAGILLNLNASGAEDASLYQYAVYDHNDSAYVMNWTTGTAGEGTTFNVTHSLISHNITFVARGYNGNLTQNLSSNYSVNTNVTPVHLRVYVYNLSGGTNENNEQSYTIVLTHSSGYTYSNSTTNGVADLISGVNTTYNINISIPQVTSTLTTIYPNTTAINSTTQSIIYNLSFGATDALNITFKNETSGAIQNDANITVTLIGPTYASEYTVTSGNLYVAGLTEGAEYEIRYVAWNKTGSITRSYYVTITYDPQDIVLYLIGNYSFPSGDETTQITATVYDDTGGYVENASIRTMRYYPALNSYETVEISKTNFEGQAHMYIVPFSEWYRFAIYYDGILKYYSGPTKITTDSITFQISLRAGILPDYFDTAGITYTLNFSNSSNTFYFNWNDDNANAIQGCLDVYRISSGTRVAYGSSCTNTSSGTVYVAVADTTNSTYEAFASVWKPDKLVLEKTSWTFSRAVAVMGKFGLLLTGILLLVVGLAGVWNPAVMFILEAVALIFTRIAGLNNFSWSIITVLSAIMIIISYLISKRS